MAHIKGASAPEQPYDIKTLAKKHRISLDDAAKILAEYGPDRKAADKAARRVAV